jgi:hypothetical protein
MISTEGKIPGAAFAAMGTEAGFSTSLVSILV